MSLFVDDMTTLTKLNERLKKQRVKSGKVALLDPKGIEHLNNAQQAISNAIKELEQIV